MVLISDTTSTDEPVITSWSYSACMKITYYPEYETIACDDFIANINRIITVPQHIMYKVRLRYKFLKRLFKSYGLTLKIIDRDMCRVYVGV